jgi:hypothetical protein
MQSAWQITSVETQSPKFAAIPNAVKTQRMEKKPGQFKHKLFLRRFVLKSKINKNYTKCKTILFLPPSFNIFLPANKRYLKKKS